jgi:hypothetical protein
LLPLLLLISTPGLNDWLVHYLSLPAPVCLHGLQNNSVKCSFPTFCHYCVLCSLINSTFITAVYRQMLSVIPFQ